MALVKVEHIFKTIRKEETPYWRLSDNGGSRNTIAENDSEENVETSIELLEEALADIDDNVVCIMLSEWPKSKKSKGGRGYKQFEFKINLGRKESSGLPGGNNSMLAMLFAQMDKTNQLQIELMKRDKDRELDELKREMKELSKGDKIDKYLPFFNKMFGMDTPVGIAEVGTEDGPVQQTKVDNQNKIRQALKRLAAIDKNLPDTLTKLATFAENNSAQYFQYMTMI